MLGIVLLVINPAIIIVQCGDTAPVALIERIKRWDFVCQSVDTVKCINLDFIYSSW